MTTPLDEAAEPARAPRPAAPAPPPKSEVATPVLDLDLLCPYLLASHGGWRSASPNRDHRCTAVDPPAPLPADKQRTLCLTGQHHGCPAFRAARLARASVVAPGLDPALVAAADASRRPIARSTAVVLEQPRLSIGSLASANVGLYQAVLVALMILAFSVVLAARLSTPSAPAVVASPSASASATPTASPTPRPTPRPTPTPSASAVPSGSAGVPASPAGSVAAFRSTYRVQAGDTLFGIAAEFDTTVSELQKLNGITGSNLRIGQELKIP
jgi:LysM repeat protein